MANKKIGGWLWVAIWLVSCSAPVNVDERQAANAPATASPLRTVTINGSVTPEEWSQAAVYTTAEGDYVSALYEGADAQNLYVRVDGKKEWGAWGEVTMGLYLKTSKIGATRSRFNSDLNFEAINLSELSLLTGNGYFGANYHAEGSAWKATGVLSVVAVQGKVLEFSFPLKELEGYVVGQVLQSVLLVSKGERLLQRVPTAETLRVRFMK